MAQKEEARDVRDPSYSVKMQQVEWPENALILQNYPIVYSVLSQMSLEGLRSLAGFLFQS